MGSALVLSNALLRRAGRAASSVAAGGVLVAFSGCFQDEDWPEIAFNISPFKNVYLDAGMADLELWAMEGYRCPDGLAARLYLVRPTAPTESSLHPLAILLHANAFDYVADNGEHYASADRLSIGWAAGEVEETLGLHEDAAVATAAQGALIATLVEQGFYVVLPTDCWGDLWHGTANNSYDEGFFRLGLYLADDAVNWALDDQPVGRDPLPIDRARVLLAGIGEGGRGVTDLIRYRVDAGDDINNDVPFTAVLIDSSPDDLRPVVTGGGCLNNSQYAEGLHRIYGIDPLEDPGCEALVTDLDDDWFGYLVASLGFSRPVAYLYSRNDDLVPGALNRRTPDALNAAGNPNLFCVKDWEEASHIFTNGDKYNADETIRWIQDAWDHGGIASEACLSTGG